MAGKNGNANTGTQAAPDYQGAASASGPMGMNKFNAQPSPPDPQGMAGQMGGNSPWGQMRAMGQDAMGRYGPQLGQMMGQMRGQFQADPQAAQSSFGQAVSQFNPQQMQQFTSNPQFQQALQGMLGGSGGGDPRAAMMRQGGQYGR